MITVYLKNGLTATVPQGMTVTISAVFAGHQAVPPLHVLICRGAQGKTVGELRLDEVIGYAITERRAGE